MEKMDMVGYLRDLAKGVTEACGGGLFAVVIMVAKSWVLIAPRF